MTQAQLIDDRQDDEVSCPRCGSSAMFEDCDQCEDGCIDHYEVDPNWYEFAPDCERYATCQTCRGKGGWWRCMSSVEWCLRNPMAGCENAERAG